MTASADQIERLDELRVTVVADVLDGLGHREQVMAPRVRPLFAQARVAGRARTVLVERTDHIPDRREDRYRMQLEAIEGLAPGDAIVTSAIDVSFWGELMSTAARAKRSPGIVVDGYVRDAEEIAAMRFATFCTGVHAADALGRCEVARIGATIVALVHAASAELRAGRIADEDVEPALLATVLAALGHQSSKEH